MTAQSPRPECRNVMKDLGDYLEEGLGPEARKGLENHLSACRECREMARQFRESLDLCRRAGTPCVDRECLERAARAARAELVQRGLIPE